MNVRMTDHTVKLPGKVLKRPAFRGAAEEKSPRERFLDPHYSYFSFLRYQPEHVDKIVNDRTVLPELVKTFTGFFPPGTQNPLSQLQKAVVTLVKIGELASARKNAGYKSDDYFEHYSQYNDTVKHVETEFSNRDYWHQTHPPQASH